MYQRLYNVSSPGGTPSNASMYSAEFDQPYKFTHGTPLEHVYGPQTIPTTPIYNTSQNFPIKQSTYSSSQLEKFQLPNIKLSTLLSSNVALVTTIILLYLFHILYGNMLKSIKPQQIYMIMVLLVIAAYMFN